MRSSENDPWPPSLSTQYVLDFLSARYGQVEQLERLGGGFWSAAYGFRSAGQELVTRFGADRSWFEADRSAMAFASAGLPVPEVIEVGAGPGGAYAISLRHHGTYLETVRADKSERAAPMLARLFESLFLVPKEPDLQVGWHWQPPKPEVGWRDWLLESLLHDANRDLALWRAKLASDSGLERLYRAAESRIRDLVPACPERRDPVHGDLLHANVLISEDASQVNAVFSWKCSRRGPAQCGHPEVPLEAGPCVARSGEHGPLWEAPGEGMPDTRGRSAVFLRNQTKEGYWPEFSSSSPEISPGGSRLPGAWFMAGTNVRTPTGKPYPGVT